MILRTLTLAAAAQGLALTRSRPRTRLQAEKPAWADAVKDEAVAEDVARRSVARCVVAWRRSWACCRPAGGAPPYASCAGRSVSSMGRQS